MQEKDALEPKINTIKVNHVIISIFSMHNNTQKQTYYDNQCIVFNKYVQKIFYKNIFSNYKNCTIVNRNFIFYNH